MSRRTKKVKQHIAISALITFLILCCLMLALSDKRESRLKMVTNTLQSEPLKDFVVYPVTSTVVLEKEEKSSVFGSTNGLLIAEVTVFYGFNLRNLSNNDLKKEKNKTIVKLGEPQIIKLSVNADSMRFFNSSMHYFKDKNIDNMHAREMLNDITAFSPQYFAARNLLPARKQMLEKLSRQLKLVNSTIEVY